MFRFIDRVTITVFDNYTGKYNIENSPAIMIQVSDSGIGIKETELPYIFNQFFRSENTKHIKGTGLGLYIAKNLVSTLQGSIFAESIYGKGSSFYIVLPKLKMP